MQIDHAEARVDVARQTSGGSPVATAMKTGSVHKARSSSRARNALIALQPTSPKARLVSLSLLRRSLELLPKPSAPGVAVAAAVAAIVRNAHKSNELKANRKSNLRIRVRRQVRSFARLLLRQVPS